MWMSFETRMRGIVQGLLEPAHDTSRADREGMINLDLKFWGLDDRLARIEEAIFNVAKKRQRRLSIMEGDHEEKQEGKDEDKEVKKKEDLGDDETYFDKMAKQIKLNEVHMKEEIESIKIVQATKFTEIDNTLFEADQRIKSCMNVKE